MAEMFGRFFGACDDHRSEAVRFIKRAVSASTGVYRRCVIGKLETGLRISDDIPTGMGVKGAEKPGEGIGIIAVEKRRSVSRQIQYGKIPVERPGLSVLIGKSSAGAEAKRFYRLF